MCKVINKQEILLNYWVALDYIGDYVSAPTQKSYADENDEYGPDMILLPVSTANPRIMIKKTALSNLKRPQNPLRY